MTAYMCVRVRARVFLLLFNTVLRPMFTLIVLPHIHALKHRYILLV